MTYRTILGEMVLGMACVFAGCAQQPTVAQDGQKGTYIHARHTVVGSNIPAPNRGSGAADTATTDLDREQYQQMQTTTTGRGMTGGG